MRLLVLGIFIQLVFVLSCAAAAAIPKKLERSLLEKQFGGGIYGGVLPTGPSGSVITAYGYFYGIAEQTLQEEQDVTFEFNGPSTPDITHPPGSSPITFAVAGHYEISFTIFSEEDETEFSLFLNGVLIPGSSYTDDFAEGVVFGQVIAAIPAGGVLTLRNTSLKEVTLPDDGLEAGIFPSVNAGIVIKYVGS